MEKPNEQIEATPAMTPVEDSAPQEQAPVAAPEASPEAEEVNPLFPDGRPKDPLRGSVRNNDAARAAYHQSRADKLAQEIAELKARLNQQPAASPAQEQAPLTPDAPAKERVAEDTPLPPKPTKPANYNPVEAVTDPQSDSFKYRVAQEEYQERLSETVAKREQARIEREQNELAQRQLAERRIAASEATKRVLVSQYGFSEAEAVDFLSTMDNPETFKAENLVRLYRSIKPKKDGGTRTPPNRLGKEVLPPSLLSMGGANEPTLSEEDAFNLGLLRNRRK